MDAREFWEKQTEVTEEVLKICPPEVFLYLKGKLATLFDSFKYSDTDLWVRYVETNPIAQRVLLYTYSPSEMIEFRQKIESISHPMWDGAQIWKVVEIKELNDSPAIINFLKQTAWHCGIVATVDRQKTSGGIEGSVEALRDRLYRVEVNENKERKITKIIREEIPWMRCEHILMKDADGHVSEEFHIYLLTDDLVQDIFDSWCDETSITWMQCFKGFPDLQSTAYSSEMEIYVYDKEFSLVKPPKGRKNPFKRALKPKYDPLLKSIPKKYKRDSDHVKREPDEEDRFNRKHADEQRVAWDLEIIFRDAIMNWHRDIPPPAYFEKALRWGFLNLEKRFEKKFIRKDELEQSGICAPSHDPLWKPLDQDNEAKFINSFDLDRTGGSLSEPSSAEQDEETRQDEIALTDLWCNPLHPGEEDIINHIDYSSKINNFMYQLEHPADKLIFLDLCDASDTDRKPKTSADISKELNAKGIRLSPQRVGQRRDAIKGELMRLFQVKE